MILGFQLMKAIPPALDAPRGCLGLDCRRGPLPDRPVRGAVCPWHAERRGPQLPQGLLLLQGEGGGRQSVAAAAAAAAADNSNRNEKYTQRNVCRKQVAPQPLLLRMCALTTVSTSTITTTTWRTGTASTATTSTPSPPSKVRHTAGTGRAKHATAPARIPKQIDTTMTCSGATWHAHQHSCRMHARACRSAAARSPLVSVADMLLTAVPFLHLSRQTLPIRTCRPSSPASARAMPPA